MYFSFTLKKIGFNTLEELVSKINSLEASKIISIKHCLPEQTDTRQWVEVYYEYVL